jgi:hypothetical protein
MIRGVVNAETFITGIKCGRQKETRQLRRGLGEKGEAVKWKC